MINVEVAYADETTQVVIPLKVQLGTTVIEAIHQSGIFLQFPYLPSLAGRVGIFGRLVPLDKRLKEGDRVEIYRALKQNPKEARRERARHFQRAASKRTTLSPLKKMDTRFSIIGAPLPGFR